MAGDGGRGGEEAERKAQPLSCQPFHALLYAQLAPELVLAVVLVEQSTETTSQPLANYLRTTNLLIATSGRGAQVLL